MNSSQLSECQECQSLFARLGNSNEQNRKLLLQVDRDRQAVSELSALQHELSRLGAPTTNEKGVDLTLVGRLKAVLSAAAISLTVAFGPMLAWEVLHGIH